ncbi:MAG TPA: molybdopterin cofactor-binding domain-containing protein, partial [Gemmatimonadales bacterium]
MSAPTMDRREFLSVTAVAGAGLTLGVRTLAPTFQRSPFPVPTDFAPNAFVRVGTDGVVTIVVGYSEMGQGILTSLPMLVAEELEVDPATVKIEQAPADPAYNNPSFGMQGTGGSTTVSAAFDPMRQAGAAAREMLAAAAATSLGVPRESLTIANGVVTHAASSRRMTYGELANAAAQIPVPHHVALKPASEWKVIGKRTRRLDAPSKVMGRATFGIDVKLPGMLTAVVARCPVFGGKVKSFTATAARAVPGVRQVVEIPSGVAVLADGYWAAKKGREALRIEWDEGANASLSSASLRARWAELAKQPGVVARHEGDSAAALASAARRIDAVYETPFLAHATMEPMNCTAHVQAASCEVWAPTQAQTMAKATAARASGLPDAAIQIHTTMLGGGFGRRFEQDFLSEAVTLSKMAHVPVKVVFSREDDIQHDCYRPATYNVLAAGLDASGNLTTCTYRSVSPSVQAHMFPLQNGLDDNAIEGALGEYAIPNVQVEWVRDEPGVPIGFWRSVGNSHTAFVKESFIDEIAAATHTDPLALRRRLLANSPRLLGVLNLAAERAGWDSPLPAGRFRGIAAHKSFNSYVAEVAEVSVGADGTPTVHRVCCAVDIGRVVNPLTVEAQVQGSIVYGLSAALRGAITLDRGRVQQENF